MTTSPSKKMVQFFRDCFRDKIGEDYVPTWGRDIKIMSGVLKYVNEEKLKKIITYFFNNDHIEKSYGIRWFKVVFNDILAAFTETEKNKPKRMVNPDSNRYG